MSTPPPAAFRPLPPERPAAELEDELLARWKEEGLFEQVQAAREGAPEFVFYEGPPTANGRPGIHHVFARTVKDLFCRHRAMNGYHVARKAGWDTHGLPVEIEVEKALGISGKGQIEELGVEAFNAKCRESVWKYRGEWEELSTRIGYWLDYEHAYVTYSNEYVESVWWALKTLFDRDRLYLGHKILPYCSRCGTALSSHEVAQGYEDVTDPSVYIALDLLPADADPDDSSGSAPWGGVRRRIVVWTTTPWTLVSNVALAVHPGLEYVELRKKGVDAWTIVLAASRAGAVLGADFADRWEGVRTIPGAELVGLRYRRPLDWVPYGEGAHEIIVGESFVSADDGSGVVHMAPAFGADDYAAGQRHGLAFLQPVNARGEFPADVPVVGGLFVKAADPLIVAELEQRDVLWKAGTMEHSYPHCWRCRTPLLYYARESWFIRTTAYRDEMLARNAAVNWNPPEVGEGRFGQWLENNIDWAISRDRFWGTPLPIWVCSDDRAHTEALGSYAELAERSGRPLPADFDPHKPFIDAYSWPCRQCDGQMRRVPEVIDTWFDSGSMPFAQWHYPFENRETVARYYPADLIAEGVDQTRGWFYSMLAIATGLGDALPNNDATVAAMRAAPYRAVVVNDMVLDAEGRKMSKSRGNIVNPWETLSRHGADAVRLFLVSSSQVWVPRRFDESMIRETAGRFLLTFKNVYSGIFALYAGFGWQLSSADPAVDDRPLIDRWVLSRLRTVEHAVNERLDAYDATAAARLVMDFFDEDVSKWYVRLSRGRFYDVDGDDNRAAFATLHEVLTVTCRLLAPFAPFVSDWVHRELTGTSVHLTRFVRDAAKTVAPDTLLESAMDAIRRLATLGRAAREEAGIKVRQPLGLVVCVVPKSLEHAVVPLAGLLAAELNVKLVEFAGSADALVTLEAKPNFRTLGKKFGKHTKLAAEAVTALSNDALLAFERGEPISVSVESETHALEHDDVTIVRRAAGALIVGEENGYLAAIDPTVSPDLRDEGYAREIVSRVQKGRKDAGYAVSDRIRLTVRGDAEIETAARVHRAWIAEQVLAPNVLVGAEADGDAEAESHHATHAVEIDGLTVHVALTRI